MKDIVFTRIGTISTTLLAAAFAALVLMPMSIQALADGLYYPQAGSKCRSQFQREYGLQLWESGQISLSDSFNQKLCSHFINEELEEAEALMTETFQALKGKVGFCYNLSDYEIYDRIDCSTADPTYPSDLLATMILQRAEVAVEDLVIVMAKTDLLNREVIGSKKNYLDIVNFHISYNSKTMRSMPIPRDPLKYEALADDNEILENMKNHLLEWGAEPYERIVEGCRNTERRKELIVKWVQKELSLANSFPSRLCESVASQNPAKVASVLHTEFKRLYRETGFCYEIADPEIYDQINCSSIDENYPRDLLLTAIKSRSERTAQLLIKSIAKRGQIRRVLPGINTTYYEHLKGQIELNKETLASTGGDSSMSRSIEDDIQLLRRILFRLKRVGGRT